MRKATQQEIKDAGDMSKIYARNSMFWMDGEQKEMEKLVSNKKARRYVRVHVKEGKTNDLYVVEKVRKKMPDGKMGNILTRRVKAIPKQRDEQQDAGTADKDARIEELTKQLAEMSKTLKALTK